MKHLIRNGAKVATTRTVPIKSATAASTHLAIGQELGVTNILPATSWMNWSGLGASGTAPGTMVVGKDPLAPTQDELVYMIRRDGQARAMLKLMMTPIMAIFAQSKWIEPDGGAPAETEFANQMWTLPPSGGGMSVSPTMFLRQTLLAMAYGFSAFEIVRQIPTVGPLKGKVTIDKMGYRDPRTISFLVDTHGNMNAMRQVTNFNTRAINVIINAEDIWYWAANEEENPYYGVSYFEAAYQHYQAKRKMYYIGELASQIAAVPGRIGEIPVGAQPSQITEFKKGLASFAFNTAMIIPPNFKVSPFNSNSQFKFTEIIDHHNTMMATSILAKFLQVEDRSIIVDTTKSDASSDMFVQLIESIVAEIAESWSNKLMPQFIDYNFGSGKYPVFQFAPITDENKQTIAELFEIMVIATSLNCTPEFVRTTEQALAKRLGYDINYDKIASQEAQIAAKQQTQMAAAAKAAAAAPAQLPGQPQNGNGPPVPGQQNVGGNPAASAPKQQPGNPAAKKPLTQNVKTSGEEMSADDLVVLLSGLFETEDIPEDFIPSVETEVIPEAGE